MSCYRSALVLFGSTTTQYPRGSQVVSPDSSTSVTRVKCEHALVFSGKCKKENWSKFSQDLRNHSLFEGHLAVVASPVHPLSFSVVPEKVKSN